MESNEIAEEIFSIPKWYASIKRIRKNKDEFLTIQDANQIKKRFRNGTISHEQTEHIFNHFGYYIADKSWVKK